ncbi:MAG: phosphoribosylamine--glycine ligase [Fimbriimonadales bacterium]
MRVLLVGGGGREHALAWAIARSPLCTQLYCAPGNAGIAQLAQTVPIPPKAIPELVRFAQQQGIDFVVVGPESPLIAGLADRLAEVNIPCFGPRQVAAMLEGSKAFAKQLMAEANVPTAPFAIFDSAEAARSYLIEQYAGRPCVVKASGEALGKGVFVCETLGEALDAVEFLMVQRGLGEAGRQVVIEDRLVGREVSLLCLTDGKNAFCMPPVRDYKRAFDNNRGPNTGGMGCYTPLADVSPELVQQAQTTIIEPTLQAMAERGTPYLGVLYAGLLIQEQQPYTLEFNCRFGDPEAQVLIPLLQSDLLEHMVSAVEGQLNADSIRFSQRCAVCVVLASGGYPNEYRTGLPIEGLERVQAMDEVIVFHAGTQSEGGRIFTAGGRVLNVVGLGDTVEQARQRAYEAVHSIQFEGMHYRTDIAKG